MMGMQQGREVERRAIIVSLASVVAVDRFQMILIHLGDEEARVGEGGGRKMMQVCYQLRHAR